MRGELDAAIADLGRATGINLKDFDSFSPRAFLKHKRGDLSGMLADLARAREVCPPDQEANSGIMLP